MNGKGRRTEKRQKVKKREKMDVAERNIQKKYDAAVKQREKRSGRELEKEFA